MPLETYFADCLIKPLCSNPKQESLRWVCILSLANNMELSSLLKAALLDCYLTDGPCMEPPDIRREFFATGGAQEYGISTSFNSHMNVCKPDALLQSNIVRKANAEIHQAATMLMLGSTNQASLASTLWLDSQIEACAKLIENALGYAFDRVTFKINIDNPIASIDRYVDRLLSGTLIQRLLQGECDVALFIKTTSALTKDSHNNTVLEVTLHCVESHIATARKTAANVRKELLATVTDIHNKDDGVFDVSLHVSDVQEANVCAPIGYAPIAMRIQVHAESSYAAGATQRTPLDVGLALMTVIDNSEATELLGLRCLALLCIYSDLNMRHQPYMDFVVTCLLNGCPTKAPKFKPIKRQDFTLEQFGMVYNEATGLVTFDEQSLSKSRLLAAATDALKVAMYTLLLGRKFKVWHDVLLTCKQRKTTETVIAHAFQCYYDASTSSITAPIKDVTQC